ncbi:hypothetical protein GCM10010271_55380 [Streptomyces kurssanovii]|nr:hypothetical protein GCM10010271_55380 [Streptomyces kurssanovii]
MHETEGIAAPVSKVRQRAESSGARNSRGWSARGTPSASRGRPSCPTDSATDADTHYRYYPAGNSVEIDDRSTATGDKQCFTYDGHRRLKSAWPAQADCATTPTAAGVGGVCALLEVVHVRQLRQPQDRDRPFGHERPRRHDVHLTTTPPPRTSPARTSWPPPRPASRDRALTVAFAYNMVLTPFGWTTLNRGGRHQRQETGLR